MTTKITLNNIADTALATLTGPKVTTIVYPGTETATDITGGATINLTGAGFQSGCSVLVASTASSVVTFISSTQISFIAPALSAGTYVIYVINPDGGTAISIPGISYSGTPNWTTTAGSLGSAYETGSISATLTATGDNPVTYSVASGTLPTGSSLASDGTLSGTAQATASATTYTFTVTAKDAQNQTTNRSFSLTINPDVVTWSSPADNTTYTVAKDTAISNVTMSATSAAGGSITYTADTLPTGLSITGANIAGTPTVTANTTTVLTATSTTTRTATKTINWVVNVSNDTYFKNTTLLLQGAGTTFVDDASTNNFAVTINGDTKPNSFNPYTPGYYSNYFDGSGDGLSVAAGNTALSFGTGDYTVEFWVYPVVFGSVSNSAPTMVAVHDGATDSGWQLYWNDGQIGIRTHYSNVVYWTASMTSYLGVWSHVAYVRSSGTQKIYVNGIERCSTNAVWNWTDTTLQIATAAQDFNGYISNLRLVKGTALYTSAFTPPSSPLTAISGTSVLTCQSNRFIDNSTNAFTIIPRSGGNQSVNSFDPFIPNSSYSTYGSGYFDGTGDWISVPNNAALAFGTGDFTVECWGFITGSSGTVINYTNGQTNNSNFSWEMYQFSASEMWFSVFDGATQYIAKSTAFKTNQWNHLAAVRSGNTLTLYVNGVAGATTVAITGVSVANLASATLKVGSYNNGSSYITGYITDVRIVKGTAVYTTSFTPPSAPLTAISGTSLLTLQNNQSANNSTFLDNSSNNFLITRAGNSTQGTFSPYGGNWSNYFDGTGDSLQAPNGGSISGTGDFTAECWVFPTVVPGTYNIIGCSDTTNGLTMFGLNANGTIFYGRSLVDVQGTTTNSVTFNAWNHIAISRSSGTLKMFVNGVQGYSATQAYSYVSGTVRIGTDGGGSALPYTGYISNFRIIKDTALYTANFTPSTTPLTPITGTSLLTCQSNRLIDNSPNNFTITKNGDVSVQRFSPFNPSLTPTSYSWNLYTSGSYQVTRNSTLSSLSTGAFTVEGWYYPTSSISSKNARILSLGRDSVVAAGNTSWDLYISNGSALVWQRINTTATTYSANYTFNLNTWYHVVACRDSSGNLALFVNGTRILLQANETTNYDYVATSNQSHYIGASYNNVAWSYALGYYSNIRVIKGATAYDPTQTTLAVPTTPLTVTAQTSMLLFSNTGSDLAGNYPLSSITRIDSQSSMSTFNPFGYTSTTTEGYSVSTIGGSGYFDGTGDYLTVASSNMTNFGTGDFTVECWAYATTNPHTNGMYLFSSRTASFANSWVFYLGSGDSLTWYTNSAGIAATTATFKANQWYHFAYSKKGTTGRLFVNGVVVSTATDSQSYGYSTPLYIGASYDGSFSFQGYISDARVVKGTALYTSNFVPPSAPLTAVQNTSLLTNMTSAGIYDASTMNNLETVGDAKLSTEVTKFGGTSMYFDGTGDYLFAPTANVNNLSKFLTSNFTVECWIYPTTTSGDRAVICAVNNWGAGANYEIELRSGLLFVQLGNGVTMTSGTTSISANTWTHIALVRSSATSTTFYVNGVSVSTYTTSWTADEDCPLTIGCFNINGGSLSNYWQGYIDDLRITKGYARYTSNFTAPTSEFKTY